MTRTLSVVAVAILVAFSGLSSAWALLLGMVCTSLWGPPGDTIKRRLTPKLLQGSIVGLGAGMNLITVAHAGVQGFLFTLVSLVCVMSVGALLVRVLRIPEKTGVLITVGTAICGGSAIAAISPILKAEPEETSVAMGAVFTLNAIALVLFPAVGHAVGMSQADFGLWSALAIHDTSSVVGATMHYGKEALEIGTTVKLARALWIVPLSLVLSATMHKEGGARPPFPWFIVGFLVVSALFTAMPAWASVGAGVDAVARRVLVATIFTVGCQLDVGTIRKVGLRAMLFAIGLWALTATAAFFAVR